MMAPPAVGLGTLRRLSALTTDGQPVLSLYLNLDREARAQPSVCSSKLDALLASSTPRPSPGHAELAHALLCGLPALANGARSLALFCCAEDSASAVVPLPDAVEAMAVLEPVPWLEPLAGLFAPGDWGVAVLGRSRTRLLRGGPRTLVEFATLHHELPGPHSLYGLSSLGARRAARRSVIEHARHLSGLLLRAHRRRSFERLVLVAPAEMCQLVESALHEQLRKRLFERLTLDLQTAPVRQIELAIRPGTLKAGRVSAHRAPIGIKAPPDVDSAVTALSVTSPEASWQS